MNNIIDNVTGGYKSSAKVSAGILVLSLPDAITPVVWRMDLSAAKSSAIEIRENEDGFYDLVLKTPKADAHKIAAYEFKIKATQALMVITKAMSKYDGYSGGGQLSKRHLPVPVYTQKPKSVAIKIIMYGYIAISLAVFMFLGFSMYNKLQKINTTNQVERYTSYKQNNKYDNFLSENTLEQPKPMASTIIQPETKTGEVMSADDFLKRR